MYNSKPAITGRSIDVMSSSRSGQAKKKDSSVSIDLHSHKVNPESINYPKKGRTFLPPTITL